MNNLSYRYPLIIVGAVLLTSCGASSEKAPEGQVLARVDGQEITLSELNAEMLANNLSGKAENKAVSRSVLQRLVARKLLVAIARDEGLDKNSEFILGRQRSEENELAALAQRNLLAHTKRPTKEEAQAYIKANPEIFNNRKLMVLEQIRFVKPANANDVKFIESAKSLDQVAELLKQAAIRFDRAPTVFDTTSVSPQMSSRIDQLPPGEVFVISNDTLVLVNVIREKRPAAIPSEAALQYANQLLQQQRASTAVESKMKELMSNAKVTYQAGYAPTK